MASALVLFIIVFFAVGWIVSSRAITVNPQKVVYDQTVSAIAGNTYTITGGAYNILGIAGGIRSDGSMIGIFSAPTSLNSSTQTSTRALSESPSSALSVGDKISLQGNIWTTDPKTALGLDFQNVTYSSPIGDMKAWLIPGANATTWVIGVHGTGADKTEVLRFVEPVHSAGNTMLIINYRNDPGNPQSPDNHNHLGDTEWQDVQAAVRYAKAHGATDIRLYGNSLGGSLVENYLRRSTDVPNTNISRVILDSPALNWSEVLRRQLQKGGYPSLLYYPGVTVLKLRTGISMDHISTQPADIKHKTLIIHSADDPTVPQNASKALAAERPDMVTLIDFKHGGHLRSWNHDRARYNQVISDFLAP
jgi:predicted alpha/beta-fold hydrolase